MVEDSLFFFVLTMAIDTKWLTGAVIGVAGGRLQSTIMKNKAMPVLLWRLKIIYAMRLREYSQVLSGFTITWKYSFYHLVQYFFEVARDLYFFNTQDPVIQYCDTFFI